MARYEILELRLDQRKLAALEKELARGGPGLEARFLTFFQTLYESFVPSEVRARIDGQLREESDRMADGAEFQAKRTAYRRAGNGMPNRFPIGIGSDILMAVVQLDQYLFHSAAMDMECYVHTRVFEMTERICREQTDRQTGRPAQESGPERPGPHGSLP